MNHCKIIVMSPSLRHIMWSRVPWLVFEISILSQLFLKHINRIGLRSKSILYLHNYVYLFNAIYTYINIYLLYQVCVYLHWFTFICNTVFFSKWILIGPFLKNISLKFFEKKLKSLDLQEICCWKLLNTAR